MLDFKNQFLTTVTSNEPRDTPRKFVSQGGSTVGQRKLKRPTQVESKVVKKFRNFEPMNKSNR